MLDNGGPNHSSGCGHETTRNFLNWCESDAVLAQSWIDEEVVERDEDEKGKGVEVSDDIVGHSVQFHNGSLGYKVVVC